MQTAKVDLNAINTLVKDGLITRRTHSEWPEFSICNYTPKAQYDRVWTPLTRMCRGLVIDNAGTIIARPLPKFFNYEEHDANEIPWHLPCSVTEKVDGSMFLVRKLEDGRLITATRGSFYSEQAKTGKELLEAVLSSKGDGALSTTHTYIFEVVYPENRIVVDYGEARYIVLLAVIETATGKEVPRENWPHIFSHVREISAGTWDDSLIAKLKNSQRENEEGFVFRFANGFRMKLKFEQYIKLHAIITRVSTKTIWESLRDGICLESIMQNTPDEFNNFVRETRSELLEQYRLIEIEAHNALMKVISLPTRKEQAIAIMSGAHKRISDIVFLLLDKQDPAHAIWKRLQPVYRQPFADRD